MSAEATKAWKERNRDRVRRRNVEYMRRTRGCTDVTCHVVAAYAERFGVSKRSVRIIGTMQLTLCRSDEARRILLRAVEASRASSRKANTAKYASFRERAA